VVAFGSPALDTSNQTAAPFPWIEQATSLWVSGDKFRPSMLVADS
jgi:hypothetical protein